MSPLDGVNEALCSREPVSLTKKRPFRYWKRATACASTEYRRDSVAAIRSMPVGTVASLTLNTSRAWLVLDRAVPASLSTWDATATNAAAAARRVRGNRRRGLLTRAAIPDRMSDMLTRPKLTAVRDQLDRPADKS